MRLQSPETRELVAIHLRAVKPLGGKGIISPRERRLADALALDCHLVVPTGKPSPFPRHYTIDVGCAMARIAIEVDGPSHRVLSVKASDRRKTRFLRELGWRVFRCTNDDIDKRFDATVKRLRTLVLQQR